MQVEQQLKTLITTKLTEKKSQNPGYSSRALARDMGISHTVLFQFMNGKRRLTPLLAYKTATYFEINNGELLEILVSTIKQ